MRSLMPYDDHMAVNSIEVVELEIAVKVVAGVASAIIVALPMSARSTTSSAHHPVAVVNTLMKRFIKKCLFVEKRLSLMLVKASMER